MGTQNATNDVVGLTTSVTTATYTVLSTDTILGVNTSSAKTITLPAPSASQNGRVITIKDSTGTAATNTITISASSSLIDGATSVVIRKNYGALQLFSDGVNYYLMNSSTAPSSYSINVQKFTASGTYTPTTGMAYAIVECVGGGGGGGGCLVNSSNYSVGTGGGAAGYIRFVVSSDKVGASQAITVGSAGAAISGSNGGSGGNSSFGSLVTGYGGTGGTASSASNNQYYSGGAGGLATVASNMLVILQIPGQVGGPSTINYSGNLVLPGAGGSTPLGYGGVGPPSGNNTTGVSGSGYGGGGSGAMNAVSTGSAAAGGAGAAGIVIITEYIP
jgi:hypothetical protein